MLHAPSLLRISALAVVLVALPVLGDTPAPGKKHVKARGNTGVRQMEIKLPGGAGVKDRDAGPQVQAKSSDSKSEAPHGRTLAADDLVIKVLDNKNRVIDKYYRKDPRLVRVEGFLNKDGKGAGRKIQAGGNLFLDVPDRADAAALEIYKAAWNGKFYALKLENRVQIPKTDNAVTMRQRGGGPTVKTIVNNGSPENKVDIVIAGDGYTAAQMDKWHADADRLVSALMKEKPYSEYPGAFNVHRIDVVSDEEGAGWIGPESKRNAFGSHFNCYNTERLL
ncbi:MAG: hypothetical protein HY042_12955, partial [Spirochaetia bacterium]|nr:hypothetical protein [Spirochaetia bacterium]